MLFDNFKILWEASEMNDRVTKILRLIILKNEVKFTLRNQFHKKCMMDFFLEKIKT